MGRGFQKDLGPSTLAVFPRGGIKGGAGGHWYLKLDIIPPKKNHVNRLFFFSELGNAPAVHRLGKMAKISVPFSAKGVCFDHLAPFWNRHFAPLIKKHACKNLYLGVFFHT